MSFAASEYHWYYQLKPCSLRVYLRAKGIQRAEPDDYHKLLVKLGQRHEFRHLNQFPEYFHAQGDVQETKAAIEQEKAVIYQPALKATHPQYGEIVGVPDFFIREDGEYLIRDCKLSRRFSEEHHPEIFRQLELYGWLYEQTFAKPPKRLETYMGDGQIQTVLYEPARALEALGFIQGIKQLTDEPFEPVGWSKCLDCGYNELCWDRAKKSHDISILPGVDQALARAFHAAGIKSYDDLLAQHNETSLAEFKKMVGGKLRKVGSGAGKILSHAKAFQLDKIIPLQASTLKKEPNVVMFDVEGIPPHLDHAEKTYLWGLKVYGDKPRPYFAALAGVGQDGDREGWQKFLEQCTLIFSAYGSIPFIHWSAYEKTQLRKYMDKYGDIDGIAVKVLENLYDLLPVVEAAFVIPTPSYGLKLIERVAGYRRKLPEAAGKWSMATYIEAVETEDPDRASQLMSEILKYNEEDLEAMWFVYEWISRTN